MHCGSAQGEVGSGGPGVAVGSCCFGATAMPVIAAVYCFVLQRGRRACVSSRSFTSRFAQSATTPAGAWWRCRWVWGRLRVLQAARVRGAGGRAREMDWQRAVWRIQRRRRRRCCCRSLPAAAAAAAAACTRIVHTHTSTLQHPHTCSPPCRTRSASCGAGWRWSTTRSTSSRGRWRRGTAA